MSLTFNQLKSNIGAAEKRLACCEVALNGTSNLAELPQRMKDVADASQAVANARIELFINARLGTVPGVQFSPRAIDNLRASAKEAAIKAVRDRAMAPEAAVEALPLRNSSVWSRLVTSVQTLRLRDVTDKSRAATRH